MERLIEESKLCGIETLSFGARKFVDQDTLVSELVTLGLDGTPTDVIIEHVHGGVFGGSKAGAKSMFTFGENYGTWRSALRFTSVVYGWRVVPVNPKQWQKLIPGLPADRAERKRAILQRVRDYYPGEKIPLYLADAWAMQMVWSGLWPA